MRACGKRGRRRLPGPGSICRLDDDVLRAVQGRGGQRRVLAAAFLSILLGSACYGFAFGLWRSPIQGLYSAAKMPVLLLATVGASAIINTMFAQVIGSGLSLRQVCAIMLLAMAVTSLILGSIAPPVVFLLLHVASPGTVCEGLPESAPGAFPFMMAYRMLLLVHVAVIGAAGVAGALRLYRLLRRLTRTRRIAVWLQVLWIAVCGFVGCELAWLLSPFLCKPTHAPHVIAREYWQQNFYERVWQALRESVFAFR